jgi:tetratricopeptide (TPR) repeat protein
MQQYRVNYPLLIGLVVGTLVCSGAVYALWLFQIERKSGWLVSEAENAVAEGNYREATKLYWQYLTLHAADAPTRIAYARAYAKLSDQDDVTPEELNMAWRVLEGAVRDPNIAAMPEAKELQRHLVELYGADNVRRYQDALDHLGYMLERDPDDAELQVMRAKYLVLSGNMDDAVKYSYKLIGYDPQNDSFDVEKATAPHDAQVYSNLAAILRAKQDNPELAERVMEQLIKVNPKSPEAYLARGRYYQGTDDAEAARADIEKAYELKPDDADVLLAMASMAATDEDYEKAGEYLEKGKKLHPQDPRFYQATADNFVKQQEYEKALAHVDEGLKTIKGQKADILLLFKADLQLHASDLKGVRQTIEDMSRSGFRSEFVEWYEARVLLAENNWFEASTALSRLRPKVSTGFGDLPQQVDNFLGLSYEKIGRPELALEQYELVLAVDPENQPALAGRERMEALLGRGEAGEADPWQEKLAEVLKQPEAQRDWKQLEQMTKKLAEERKWDDATKKIVEAQLALMRKDFAAAGRALAEANKLSPKNLQIFRMRIQLELMNPKAGPAEALKVWQKVVEEFGDQPGLRLDKADILIAMSADQPNKDELKVELNSLVDGIENWTTGQKAALWSGMAARYLNLGMLDEARQYLTLAADAQPAELPLRVSLFTLALEANDDAGMKDAQKKILEVVGNTNDSAWLYTEARRKLSLVRRGQLGPEALDEIRVLVSRALEQRREWHELHVLNAELELQAGNTALALEHYDRAEELGRPSPTAVATHIRLLAAAGRFADAGKYLDRIPEALRQTLLGQLYPEVLFRTNQVESAIKQAREAAKADPENAEKHYWHSQLLARSAQDPKIKPERRTQILRDAIKTMEKAVELQPEFPEAWFALISYHSLQKDGEQAQAALRNAQLSLSGDNLQMFLAKSYEALGRWFDAETMYRAVYEAAPDSLSRAQQLAAFYLGPAYRQPDQQAKATPLINQILRAGAEGKIQANDPGLFWARRMGASMLAATGDYQNIRKAEKLLASNSQEGVLSIEDKLAMAQILSSRPEPRSRLAAIALLEEVSSFQPLNEAAEIMLGDLYFKVGRDWNTYASQMEKAIARFPESVAAREAYLTRLLSRSDQRSLAKATTHASKLQQLAPQSASTFSLAVRLADKLGRQKQARQKLLSMVPNLAEVKELNPQQVQMLAMLANLLVEVDDIDSAERIYRELAARDPNQVSSLALFLGLHRDVEQCFAKLKEIYTPERIPMVLQVALSVVRQRRDAVGDKFDAEIQRWLDAGLRENPDSINLQMVQADFNDLQRRYDEAAAIYRKLLDRKDLVGIRRAIVLNNLAFLVALAGSSASSDVDALKLIQEAAQIMGPNSDILDTRAVVYISRKQPKEAIHDLELAVTDNPTDAKYFHKAQAHLLAGENAAAVEAWDKAEELGLARDSLNRMEHDSFEDVKAKIEQIRGASVTQAEPRRRAG